MFTRRGFVGCALCALAGFDAADAGAEGTPTLKRTILSRADGPAEGFETLEVKIEIAANSVIVRHIHYGVETTYVIEGAIDLDIEGVGAKTYAAGQGIQVPTRTPHGGKCGDKPAKLFAVYVVEKGKPLATPV